MMSKKQFWPTLMALALTLNLVSCSSKKKDPEPETVDNSETIKLDYEVRDASSKFRPTWVENPSYWASQNEKEFDKNRYFAFQTEPKVNRETACSLARANVKSDIASEISTFIQRSLGFSKEGQASIDENDPNIRPMREFVEDTLAEKISAIINGAAIIQTYWEKRQYLESKGAKRDYIGYTCGVLVRMETTRLKAAVEEASKKILDKVDDPGTKENVKKALEKAEEDYLKTKQGQL